ncbi:DUF697 domain-containing protein [Neolewinella lacunae]|uniref:DUF697 domain-containing protein n=1 Tax=Neolewinella lacunae TaxID=1517758 RepID=A0A923PGV3_9BACT|nr:DUF697 domain-containing protein [Neolewinella lacunae]MBC6993827.1 DUF697 domain-containing protein [Neolewinella lacunae]MDN3635282.1 DUF697 domain-containing protein [Neolewinella lacunae]
MSNPKNRAEAELSTAAAGQALTTADQNAKREEAEGVIRRYALFGTASGLIPTFGLDVAVATAIQTRMIKELADIYEFDIDDQIVRTAMTTGITALAGRLLSGIAASVAESFSPLKFLVGGATSAAVSGFLTLEIGYLYQTRMEEGQNPADIGVMEIVNHVVAQIQQGKWDPTRISLTSQLGDMLRSKE